MLRPPDHDRRHGGATPSAGASTRTSVGTLVGEEEAVSVTAAWGLISSTHKAALHRAPNPDAAHTSDTHHMVVSPTRIGLYPSRRATDDIIEFSLLDLLEVSVEPKYVPVDADADDVCGPLLSPRARAQAEIASLAASRRVSRVPPTPTRGAAMLDSSVASSVASDSTPATRVVLHRRVPPAPSGPLPAQEHALRFTFGGGSDDAATAYMAFLATLRRYCPGVLFRYVVPAVDSDAALLRGRGGRVGDMLRRLSTSSHNTSTSQTTLTGTATEGRRYSVPMSMLSREGTHAGSDPGRSVKFSRIASDGSGGESPGFKMLQTSGSYRASPQSASLFSGAGGANFDSSVLVSDGTWTGMTFDVAAATVSRNAEAERRNIMAHYIATEGPIARKFAVDDMAEVIRIERRRDDPVHNTYLCKQTLSLLTDGEREIEESSLLHRLLEDELRKERATTAFWHTELGMGLIRRLVSNDPTLTVLRLPEQATAANLNPLLDALTLHQSVEEVCLDGSDWVNDVNADTLCAKLLATPSVTKVSLRDTPLTTNGALVLLAAARRSATLRSLDLAGTDTTEVIQEKIHRATALNFGNRLTRTTTAIGRVSPDALSTKEV